MNKLIISLTLVCFTGATLVGCGSGSSTNTAAIDSVRVGHMSEMKFDNSRHYRTTLQEKIPLGIFGNIVDIGQMDGDITPDDGKGVLGVYIANKQTKDITTEQERKDGLGNLQILIPKTEQEYISSHQSVYPANYYPDLDSNYHKDSEAVHQRLNFKTQSYDLSLTGGHSNAHVVFFKYADPLIKEDVYFKMTNTPTTVTSDTIEQAMLDFENSLNPSANLQGWHPNKFFWWNLGITVVMIALDCILTFSTKGTSVAQQAIYRQMKQKNWAMRLAEAAERNRFIKLYIYNPMRAMNTFWSINGLGIRMINIFLTFGAWVVYAAQYQQNPISSNTINVNTVNDINTMLHGFGGNEPNQFTFNLTRLEAVTPEDVEKYADQFMLKPSKVAIEEYGGIFNANYAFVPVDYNGSVSTTFKLSDLSTMLTPALSNYEKDEHSGKYDFSKSLKNEKLVGDRTPDSSDWIFWKQVKTHNLMNAAILLEADIADKAILNETYLNVAKAAIVDHGLKGEVYINDAPNVAVKSFSSEKLQNLNIKLRNNSTLFNASGVPVSGLLGYNGLAINSGDKIELILTKPQTTLSVNGEMVDKMYQNPVVNIIDADTGELILLGGAAANEQRKIRAYYSGFKYGTVKSGSSYTLTLDLKNYRDASAKIWYLLVQDQNSKANVIPIFVNNITTVAPSNSYNLELGGEKVSNSVYNLQSTLSLDDVKLDLQSLPDGVNAKMTCYNTEGETSASEIHDNVINLPGGSKAHCKISLQATASAASGDDYNVGLSYVFDQQQKRNIVTIPVSISQY